jgi:leader peptidase (prepilin peptidase)/N-methyltransferase
VAYLFLVIGVVWGLISDRIAARWPAHEDGHVRRIDWRTWVVVLVGAWAFFLLSQRFPADTHLNQLLLFSGWFLALTLLMATDLDQRLLPDVITLPLIPITFLVTLLGWNPLVPTSDLPAAIAVALIMPAVLFAISIPFGEGAIGLGDLKLLVSVGLLSGLQRTVTGIVAGILLSGLVILILLATRRVTLRSFIPFGPFLIIGAYWAVLLRT